MSERDSTSENAFHVRVERRGARTGDGCKNDVAILSCLFSPSGFDTVATALYELGMWLPHAHRNCNGERKHDERFQD
jgi:hypothetical protein